MLRGLTLEAQAGKTTALVGLSGSGKTTIMNLIMRFWDPDQGAVMIDGQDLRDVTLQSLRSQVALVSQDVFLFDGTIGENIAAGIENREPRTPSSPPPRPPMRIISSRAARRIRHPGRRARRPVVGRPAPAHFDRARLPEERPDHPPRRADLGARQRVRAGDPDAPWRSSPSAARPWSSPTASPRCSMPTASMSSTMDVLPKVAHTASCSASAASIPASTTSNMRPERREAV